MRLENCPWPEYLNDPRFQQALELLREKMERSRQPQSEDITRPA
jgi:hypothetical protein